MTTRPDYAIASDMAAGVRRPQDRGTMNPWQGFGADWWGDVLGQYEPAQYYSSPAARRFTAGGRLGAQNWQDVAPNRYVPSRQRFFENSYDAIMRDYYGSAGSAMRQGVAPMSFDQFLDTDPWTKRYTSLPQTARGATGMATNPRTRFLYNF